MSDPNPYAAPAANDGLCGLHRPVDDQALAAAHASLDAHLADPIHAAAEKRLAQGRVPLLVVIAVIGALVALMFATTQWLDPWVILLVALVATHLVPRLLRPFLSQVRRDGRSCLECYVDGLSRHDHDRAFGCLSPHARACPAVAPDPAQPDATFRIADLAEPRRLAAFSERLHRSRWFHAVRWTLGEVRSEAIDDRTVLVRATLRWRRTLLGGWLTWAPPMLLMAMLGLARLPHGAAMREPRLIGAAFIIVICATVVIWPLGVLLRRDRHLPVAKLAIRGRDQRWYLVDGSLADDR